MLFIGYPRAVALRIVLACGNHSALFVESVDGIPLLDAERRRGIPRQGSRSGADLTVSFVIYVHCAPFLYRRAYRHALSSCRFI